MALTADLKRKSLKNIKTCIKHQNGGCSMTISYWLSA